MKNVATRILAAASAASLLVSAPAAAASAAKGQTPDYSPWAMLSATHSPASAQALCGSATTVAAAQATPGCVLPALDPPAPVATSQPVAVAPSAVSVASAGVGVLPLLLGLAALGGLAALLLSTDNGSDQINIGQPQPISP